MTSLRPSLEVWQLICAITAAERGSIRRAAEDLGTRPAHIRRHLLRIEDVTGLSLFHRTHAGIRTTREGERFLKEATRLLHDFDGLSNRKYRDWTSVNTVLRAGIQAPVITGRMTTALAKTRARRPDVEIILESRGRRRLLRALDLGYIDVAILAGDFQAHDFETRHLWTERLAIALPETHRFAGCRALAWADVRGETFVTGSDGRGQAFERILRRNLGDQTDTPRVIRQKVPQADILGFVRAGIALCLTTDAWREMRVPGVQFVTLTGGNAVTHLDYTAAWRQGQRNDALDLFIETASTFAATGSIF